MQKAEEMAPGSKNREIKLIGSKEFKHESKVVRVCVCVWLQQCTGAAGRGALAVALETAASRLVEAIKLILNEVSWAKGWAMPRFIRVPISGMQGLTAF